MGRRSRRRVEGQLPQRFRPYGYVRPNRLRRPDPEFLELGDILWAAVENRENVQDLDFIFIVGSKKIGIPCHRQVVCARSAVFATICSSRRTEDKKCVTEEIPEVEQVELVAFLRYLYTGQLSVTVDDVFEVASLAQKYNVPALLTACGTWIRENINLQNFLTMFEKCSSSNVAIANKEEFLESILSFVAREAKHFFESDGFTAVKIEVLQSVLQKDDLDIDEFSVFQYALKWASAECERQGLTVNPTNQRHVLGEVFSFIRFPLISSSYEEFEEVQKSGILTERELIVLLKLEAFAGHGPVTSRTEMEHAILQDTPHSLFITKHRSP